MSTLKPTAAANLPAEPSAAIKPQLNAGRTLPDAPLVTIQPTRSWMALNLRDLWAYRELLYFMAWRDIKVRYKQTALGVAWVVMQPLLTTAIFTLFLGKLARVPSDGAPYALMVYAGLLPWSFFSGAVTAGGNSLVTSSALITKVYFPRLVIPAAAIGARLVDFAIAFVILIGLMLYYGVAPTARLLLLAPLVLLVTMLAAGFGMLTSAMNVKYRDVGVVLPVVMQLWMFVSPVLYPASLVPAKWQPLFALNPMAGIIDGFRGALLGGRLNWAALSISAAATAALLVFSAYFFRRVEKTFADII
ncbi:MAG TPA: ABC transporter permease [Pyrinomonadaceae bacterium]|jgi:lipopolysaccharide transport system permease protein